MIGAGIAGLAAAWTLAKNGAEVVIFEKEEHLGGHAWTIEADNGRQVDVGFMVFNQVTYPNLVEFFKEIDVDIEASDMSFSVSLDGGKGIEWGSGGILGLFAQKRNALRPSFLYMIREMFAFKKDVLEYELDITMAFLDYPHLASFLLSSWLTATFQKWEEKPSMIPRHLANSWT